MLYVLEHVNLVLAIQVNTLFIEDVRALSRIESKDLAFPDNCLKHSNAKSPDR